MHMETALAPPARTRLKQFKITIAYVILSLSLLALWTGTDFLKESVFKHYFNPTRHVIIEQGRVVYTGTNDAFRADDAIKDRYLGVGLAA